MTWTPESIKMAMLTPEQANPFHQAFTSGHAALANALKEYDQYIKNAKGNAELPYAGALAKSTAEYKAAMARYLLSPNQQLRYLSPLGKNTLEPQVIQQVEENQNNAQGQPQSTPQPSMADNIANNATGLWNWIKNPSQAPVTAQESAPLPNASAGITGDAPTQNSVPLTQQGKQLIQNGITGSNANNYGGEETVQPTQRVPTQNNQQNLPQLHPEEQEVYKKTLPTKNDKYKSIRDAYSLQRLKMTTDPVTRNRLLLGRNAEATQNRINVEDLTHYSGLNGGELLNEVRKDLSKPGSASPQYYRYLKSLQNAKLLAKQTRQFYGDSISPSNLATINSITNPTSILKSPKAAADQFNAVMETLNSEIANFENAMSSADIYYGRGQYKKAPQQQTSSSNEGDLVWNEKTQELE